MQISGMPIMHRTGKATTSQANVKDNEASETVAPEASKKTDERASTSNSSSREEGGEPTKKRKHFSTASASANIW